MSIFSSKNESYLGIDLGTSSIKICELANSGGRPRLVTYGFSEKNVGAAGDDNLLNRTDETALAIKNMCEKASTTSKKAITALPNFSVFSSILNLPSLPKKELSSAISWEAKKIIPTPLEEVILDWKIVDEIESGNTEVSSPENPQQTTSLKRIFSKPHKNLRILLTGANKILVKKYIDIFNKADLNLLSLETENFALIRSLIGSDKSNIMLIDLGAATSSITVVEKGIPVLSRSLELGGFMITKAISVSLNINLDRAEQFKQDMSLDNETADNSLPQTVEKSFSSILHEIKYTLDLYQDQNHKKVEKIILSGGSSLLGHLPKYLSDTLNINTYIGDPWAKVVFPMELKPILDRIGAKFAVAVGLAMRDIS